MLRHIARKLPGLCQAWINYSDITRKIGAQYRPRMNQTLLLWRICLCIAYTSMNYPFLFLLNLHQKNNLHKSIAGAVFYTRGEFTPILTHTRLQGCKEKPQHLLVMLIEANTLLETCLKAKTAYKEPIGRIPSNMDLFKKSFAPARCVTFEQRSW